MAPSESLEIAHRELENANSGNKKDVIDHEKDEEEDQEEDDNKTRKDACRKADCKVLRDSLNCSTAGTYSKIGFVPLLSIKNMGYLFASVSSGISGLRPRFFSMEGAGGRTGYTIFVGSPYGAPTTVFAIMQPTRVGPAPEGPLKFLLEQALISSPARDRVPLKSKLIRFGKFEDSACTFKEDTPFRALPAGLPDPVNSVTMEPQPSSAPEFEQEPELFAASASEKKAIASGKTESDASDLSALSEEPHSATRKEHDDHQQAVGKKESEESTESKTVSNPETSKVEQEVASVELNASDPNSERPLSKEELIEEALNCPCISSMKEGSCGDSFIDAYKCFLQSETEPKGMDCMDQFKTMQSCLAEHPEEYNLDDDEADDPFAMAKEKQEQDTPKVAAEPPSA
ncbi:unnamed protein product [Agarophyton chilense]